MLTKTSTTKADRRNRKKFSKAMMKKKVKSRGYLNSGAWVIDSIHERIDEARRRYSAALNEPHNPEYRRELMKQYFKWKTMAKSLEEHLRDYKGLTVPLP